MFYNQEYYSEYKTIKPEETKPVEIQCWCGLRKAGQGGVHADYCHPELIGKPELPPE